EEGLVLPVIDPGDRERSAQREAGPVRGAVDPLLAPGLPEEVVGAEARRLREEVDRAVQRVRAGLDRDAGDAALGVAELRVEGRGLHPELLAEVGGRDVGGD